MAVFLSLRLLSLLILAPRAASVSFSFNFSSSGEPCDGELRCERDTRKGPGWLELTKDEIRGNPFSVGRASYARPVPLWNNASGELASFTSNFTFQIKPKNESFFIGYCNVSGDGMAFFLTHYPSRIPPNSFGSNLGLFSDSSNIYPGGNDQVVAVEFDTFYSGDWDKASNHMGIDVNSIQSQAYVQVTKGLVSEDAVMAAKISYDNVTGVLAANLQIDGGELYNVRLPVDMRSNLPNQVAVGFSAGTGTCIELHRVLSWSFSSTLETASSKVRAGSGRRRLVRVIVPVAVAFLLVTTLLCALVFCLVRHRHIWKKLHGVTDDDSDGEHEFERGVGPRRYHYGELATATNNFAEEEKLGRGGFGNVYRGRLSEQVVAVKMFSAESSVQGRKAFEAEVKTISRLRHRNLVQLLGWSDSRRGLLLVYELVSQGSLDRHLYGGSLLTWQHRYAIILGLGSALRYLHTEWDQCVLHGDIKPSNILLDSSHSTKLGDFGLARLVEHGAGPRTTQVVMGTAGYIDPVFIRTRRPSAESDVYSFGVVLLEIVTGRRPEMEHPDRVIPLLNWIWDLYGRNALMEALDEKLAGGSWLGDDGGCEWQVRRALVVGLWCAHPDPGVRPSIVQAVNVLQSKDITLPVLSRQVYSSTTTSSSLSHGSSGYDAPAGINIISSDDMSWVLSGGR